jgi:peptidoglycan hydrolase-like protein with peptidoglycan-binding domain
VSFLGRTGGQRRTGAARRRQLIAATAGTAAAALVAGGALTGCAGSSGSQKIENVGDGTTASASAQAASISPLRLLSVSPAAGTKKVNGGAPVTLKFSAPLSASTPLPTLSPKIAGNWKISGTTAVFTPTAGFLPETRVTVSVPAGSKGMTAATSSATPLAKTATVHFTTGSYTTAGLQLLLARLGYLPLNWTASGASPATVKSLNAQVVTAYDPGPGKFTFKPGYPAELTSQWKPGKDNKLDEGAIRAFENNQGLTMDGTAGSQVWSRLLTAAAKDKKNPDGYTYALASQHSPETLKVWHNGKVILNTPSNTGIPGASTVDGTYPVYERLQFQIMKGKNPDGTKYADPVYWVAYFNGGDAVHYFDRASYGYYQSLGCVELPWTAAKHVWPSLTYGTLVTVTGPVA